MALPDSYILKPASLPAYFDAILDAQAPERFSTRYLEKLGFASNNDRLLIRLLKELGFLNSDGAPQPRYFEFLDRSQSKQVLAEAVREAFSDLYAVHKNAHELSKDEIKNKLRTLYAGKKNDETIDRIARTFTALVEYADFSSLPPPAEPVVTGVTQVELKRPSASEGHQEPPAKQYRPSPLGVGSLQYHINIVLPESRDQAVYDAIFKSLREHLG
jgi:DNA-binding TFAR19-related protein (PDSD5 family)